MFSKILIIQFLSQFEAPIQLYLLSKHFCNLFNSYLARPLTVQTSNSHCKTQIQLNIFQNTNLTSLSTFFKTDLIKHFCNLFNSYLARPLTLQTSNSHCKTWTQLDIFQNTNSTSLSTFFKTNVTSLSTFFNLYIHTLPNTQCNCSVHTLNFLKLFILPTRKCHVFNCGFIIFYNTMLFWTFLTSHFKILLLFSTNSETPPFSFFLLTCLHFFFIWTIDTA